MKQICLLLSMIFMTIIPLSTFANEEDDDQKNVEFYQITPDIVTNLDMDANNPKVPTFMIRIVLMAKSEAATQLLKQHQARYRDPLILFINKHHRHELRTRKQKKKFKNQIKTVINNSIKQEIKDQAIVQRVLFTRIVIE